MNTEYVDNIEPLFFIKKIFENKTKIILFSLFCSIIGIFVSLSIPNTYQSSALLSLNNNSSGGSSISSLAKQYGGVASMAGISLPGDESEDRGVLAMETIKSRYFFNNLMSKYDLLPKVFAVKSYNYEDKSIIFDDKLYRSADNTWVRKPSFFNKNRTKKPSYQEAYRIYIKEIISIGQNKKTNLISISVKHHSPIFAKDFLEIIINEMNDSIRRKDLDDSQKAINYLNNSLQQYKIAEIKKSINNLIETHLEKVMMSTIAEDYVLEVIDPPFIPELKYSPSRFLIVFMSLLLGFLISFIWVSARYLLDISNKKA